jgi:hypothetical protein
LFETEIGEATVVTLFLWPEVNLKLRPKLWRELKLGTRVVSYIHSMGDWRPQKTINLESARGPRKFFSGSSRHEVRSGQHERATANSTMS